MMRGCFLLLLGHAGAGLVFENMNGEYVTTPTPHAKGRFNTNWSEYPGGVEYFDVHLGPITTLYSQVWWKTLPTVPLPPELVSRFDKRAMAIVGYETDSVRRTPRGDVSVPINMAYNHHHDVYLTGKHSRRERVPYDPLDLTIPPMARSDPAFLTVPVEHSPSPAGLPTSTSRTATAASTASPTTASRAPWRTSSTRRSRFTATPCS
jgi:hypothetical protein